MTKVSPEFKELERLRSITRHNEASALRFERDETEARVNIKWQGVVADKDAENERLRLQIAELQKKLEK